MPQSNGDWVVQINDLVGNAASAESLPVAAHGASEGVSGAVAAFDGILPGADPDGGLHALTASSDSHHIGNLVASIAAFSVGDSFAHGAQAAPSEATTVDAAHSLGSADLSDVGALLNHSTSDVAASNIDLDHLTSNLNLFDIGHVDAALDTHHG